MFRQLLQESASTIIANHHKSNNKHDNHLDDDNEWIKQGEQHHGVRAKDGGCQVGEIMSEWTSIADHIGGDGSSAADCKEGLDFEGGCFACDDIIVG